MLACPGLEKSRTDFHEIWQHKFV